MRVGDESLGSMNCVALGVDRAERFDSQMWLQVPSPRMGSRGKKD